MKNASVKLMFRIINAAKAFLKKDENMIKTFQEYEAPIEIIDHIPVFFKKIDVSATTEKGIIYLNEKLLEDKDFFKNYGYFAHEITHFLQQCFNDKPTKSSDDGNYLENEYELEAFQNQVKFLSDHLGNEDAEEYVEDLVDYHEVPKNKAEDKKEELLEKVEEE